MSKKNRSLVYLLGAGPGDPGLLTVKARDVLSRADVIIYDYLANKAFLNYARPEAEIIYVGKKGGDHTLPQDKINDLIVAKAGEGKIVARLKGGDPYVFGRGAEEAEELLEAGLDFEVVPGVTSAVAAPAYAGIPLTHRSFASSVSFITGHENPDKPESAHNWKALATGTSTLVFFMGVKNIKSIADNLMKEGMSPEMPVALVRWGTTGNHRSWTSTLGAVVELVASEQIRPPSLLVVGHVVTLHDKLNWFEKKPLLGQGVVVTRARHQASSLVAILEDMGAVCHQFPTIKINPLKDWSEVDAAVDRIGVYEWLVFTSVNGVVHFFDRLAALGRDARSLGKNKIAAIGPATASELEKRGIKADFIPPKYVAESIVQGMLDLGVKGRKVLIPRAKVAREVLPEELAKAGAEVEVLPVYETSLEQSVGDEVVSAMQSGEIQFVTFTSSSTVENFFDLVSPEIFRQTAQDKVKIACIGPVTAATLSRFGFSPDIMPDNYLVPDLARAIADYVQNSGE